MNDPLRPRRPRPRKRFGQHFLVDQGVVEQVFAALSLVQDDHVIEVGPGLGALTERLLTEAASVAAVEIDRDLAARLTARFPTLQLEVADVLRTDLAEFAQRTRGHAAHTRIVGNLPYKKAPPLLGQRFALATSPNAPSPHPITAIHLMFQREVADRLTAPLGSADYGRLTVMAQTHCHIERLFDVDPRSFRPAPKVRSAFVRLRPRPDPPHCDLDALSHVLRTAFSKRRKTVANALAPLNLNLPALG
ncbi:MAG: 16S rRNA (adenine(1518)-N(6)/adenine(1519)-N(6))-dimethyltransferase RsmA, partial [Gammaproteobacteria bacterium]|nr:16S rRNA (adenine(1518)-N(6)/adenine(1519)-N(6))-dimethyltransferase RsmA [Gammaproteobacteria bacterium]